jgi:hypothetical protein
MGWNYKDEELAMTIEITQGDEPVNTDDIYYKLIEVDANASESIKKLEKKVNKYINKAGDEFMPHGAPFMLNGRLVQMLVDVEEMY